MIVCILKMKNEEQRQYVYVSETSVHHLSRNGEHTSDSAVIGTVLLAMEWNQFIRGSRSPSTCRHDMTGCSHVCCEV